MIHNLDDLISIIGINSNIHLVKQFFQPSHKTFKISIDWILVSLFSLMLEPDCELTRKHIWPFSKYSLLEDKSIIIDKGILILNQSFLPLVSYEA